jgi:hypothetical protein
MAPFIAGQGFGFVFSLFARFGAERSAGAVDN